MGFYVYEITPEKFASDGREKIGSITVICDGASVPKSLEEPLERYLTQNGRLFIFGGPLFGIDNITEKAPVIEGISPLYKTFAQEKCESFETLENAVTDATLHGSAARTICPNARPIGEGFDMGRRCRFLPLVSVKNGDDGARDGGKNQPIEWRLEEQRQYQAQFNRLFGFCASKGSMPWFYPGGFRFTEHSDCGYVAQNGSLRPAFREYLKSGDFFSSGKGKREEKKITEYAHVDPEGELSYWCKFVSADGREYAAENGGELRLDVGIYTVEVGVGNLAAATWLSGSCDGDVMLKVGKKYIPLEKDVRYLSDGVARGEYSVNFAEKIELRLSARGRADFGEIFRISIKI